MERNKISRRQKLLEEYLRMVWGTGKKKKNQHNSVVSASKEHMKGSINPLKRYKMLGK